MNNLIIIILTICIISILNMILFILLDNRIIKEELVRIIILFPIGLMVLIIFMIIRDTRTKIKNKRIRERNRRLHPEWFEEEEDSE